MYNKIKTLCAENPNQISECEKVHTASLETEKVAVKRLDELFKGSDLQANCKAAAALPDCKYPKVTKKVSKKCKDKFANFAAQCQTTFDATQKKEEEALNKAEASQ